MVELTIVITYYKTYELTEKLMEVLIPQLNNNVEVLLIDDGCNETRLDKYPVNVIHLKENVGGASASNVGIEKAQGKYIAFIDSDDLISNDYVKVLLDTISNHNEEVIFMDWQDMNTLIVFKRPNNYAQWKAIYRKDIIPRFPDGRRYSYDVPFYDELNKKGYTKYYIDKVLYYYNSNRPGCLSLEKREAIEKEKKI